MISSTPSSPVPDERLKHRRGLPTDVTDDQDADGTYRTDPVHLEASLSRMTDSDGLLRHVEVHTVLGSTNRHVLEAGQEGLLVVALEQTEGRGRHGALWASPPGGIYLSYMPPIDIMPTRPTDLSILASLAVATVVEGTLADMGVQGPRALLKWPNDVLVGDGKVAGVLVQSRDPPLAAVGIGLNVNVTPAPDEDRPPEEWSVRPRSLREVAGRPLDITAVLTDLVDGLTRWVGTGLDEAALEEYRSRCHTLGKQVVFTEGEVRRSGTAIDISPDRGGLLVRLEGGEVREVTSGEVRHVRSVKG